MSASDSPTARTKLSRARPPASQSRRSTTGMFCTAMLTSIADPETARDGAARQDRSGGGATQPTNDLGEPRRVGDERLLLAARELLDRVLEPQREALARAPARQH